MHDAVDTEVHNSSGIVQNCGYDNRFVEYDCNYCPDIPRNPLGVIRITLLKAFVKCAFGSVSDFLSYFGDLGFGTSHECGGSMYPPVHEIFQWALANYQLESGCEA